MDVRGHKQKHKTRTEPFVNYFYLSLRRHGKFSACSLDHYKLPKAELFFIALSFNDKHRQ